MLLKNHNCLIFLWKKLLHKTSEIQKPLTKLFETWQQRSLRHETSPSAHFFKLDIDVFLFDIVDTTTNQMLSIAVAGNSGTLELAYSRIQSCITTCLYAAFNVSPRIEMERRFDQIQYLGWILVTQPRVASSLQYSTISSRQTQIDTPVQH